MQSFLPTNTAITRRESAASPDEPICPYLPIVTRLMRCRPKPLNPSTGKCSKQGTDFTFRDLKVRSFALPHDAYDPVGFTFNWGEDGDLFTPARSLAWVTDLGYVPEHVKEHIRHVHTLVIEANYDEELLERDERRPWSIKQRIRGRHGHLSNNAAFDLVTELS
jgi:phosphoribosyl 1,2-cyclic phosphodiesterase